MTAKQENQPLVWGNRNEGWIQSGYLNQADENSLESDCESGLHMQAKDSRHYCSMENDGPRPGWTINRCPGTYEIRCASDTDHESIGFYALCENGDVVIGAPNGNVRIYGVNIDILANRGSDNKTGVINIESNEAVNIRTQTLDVTAKTGARIFTPYTLDLVGNTTLNLVSNFVDSLSSATSSIGNKSNKLSVTKYKGKQEYVK